MSNIFFFHGTETYPMVKKIQVWKKEFIKKHGEINLETHEGKDLDPSSFLSNIEALPFLGEKRLVIVKNFLKKGREPEKVLEKLTTIPETTILVFLEESSPDKRKKAYKLLSKIAKTEESQPLDPQGITNWILDYAKRNQININFANARYLAEYCEKNLWTISSELEKLKAFTNGQPITKLQIEKLATPSLSTSIFKLTDSLAARQKKQSIQNLAEVIESGEEIGRIFHMILRHFRIMTQLLDLRHQGMTDKEIAKKLAVHPFVVQNTARQLKNFTAESLKKIYKSMVTIDHKSKTGGIKSAYADSNEFRLEIEKLIINSTQ